MASPGWAVRRRGLVIAVVAATACAACGSGSPQKVATGSVPPTVATSLAVPAPVSCAPLARCPTTSILGCPPPVTGSGAVGGPCAVGTGLPPTSVAGSGSPATPPVSTDGPAPGGEIATHLADTTDVPSGFLGGGVDGGLVGAGGLDSGGRRWTRTLVGGGQDLISLFVTQFGSAAAAVDFNANFALEYQAGPLARHDTITGIPDSNAYLDAESKANPATATTDASGSVPPRGQVATAWFTVGPIAVGISVMDSTEDPLGVAETLAQAQYRLLRS